jgi:hypothetical protein
MHDSLPIHPFIYPISFVKSVRLLVATPIEKRCETERAASSSPLTPSPANSQPSLRGSDYKIPPCRRRTSPFPSCSGRRNFPTPAATYCKATASSKLQCEPTASVLVRAQLLPARSPVFLAMPNSPPAFAVISLVIPLAACRPSADRY